MPKTIALTLNRELISDRRITALIGVLFFVTATALGAYVRIPVNGSPVPITFQTFFVIMAGAVLGKRLGTFSQIGYVALSTGFLYLLGPTGGYIVGFIAAAYLVGRLTSGTGTTVMGCMLAFSLGSLIIHAFGVAWLAYAYNIGIVRAIMIGSIPFLAGDAIKIALAALIYHKIRARARELF